MWHGVQDRGGAQERDRQDGPEQLLLAVAKARVWASEGWKVTIIVGDEDEIAPADARQLVSCDRRDGRRRRR